MPKVSRVSASGGRKSKQRASNDVVARIAPLKPLSEGIKLSLYGRSGTGKTTFWATFPKPILAVIASGGSQPGELLSIDTPEYRKTIDQVALQESSEIRPLTDHIVESGKYQTVVLDHATGLQDLVLKEILGLDELPAQKSWGMAKREDWGQCSLQMKELLRALLNLPCNVVIVAQEREFNVEESGELLTPYVGSALTPSVMGWLNPACDYICQTFIRPRMVEKRATIGGKEVVTMARGSGVEYCLRTGPHDVYITKFRIPRGTVLPDVIVDPTYDKFIKLVKGQSTASSKSKGKKR